MLPTFAASAFALLLAATAAIAQQAGPAPAPAQAQRHGTGSTTVSRSGGEAVAPSTPGAAKLEALLTAEGQRIDQGLVWRVFTAKPEADGRPKLLATFREPTPVLRMAPGDYRVNAAFGRANLTRKITIKPGAEGIEQFVLNAGGLRVQADVAGAEAAANAITYTIYSDERDALGNRAVVMSGAKPGMVIRLNAGIYQVASLYGDANAIVRADVTVEAGKLTEANISHTGGKVGFKLVTEPGGDAVPDTQWSIQTMQGEVVKESVGALPTHILAPGTYAAFAKKGGKTWRRDFLLRPGDVVQVEIVMQ